MSSPSCSSSNTGRLYLNCPFEDKDQVKRLGALWDASKRQWYIVPETPSCRIFAPWLPKNYLDCPYTDKDEVKSRGAKWDAAVKRWYVPTHIQDETVFAPWLGPPPKKKSMASSTSNKKKPSQPTKKSTPPSSSSVRSPPQPKSKKTVAPVAVDKATLPRISADMTVQQLRDECLTRNPAMKGLGSKDKTWLLEHLQLGFVWISASHNVAPPKKMAPSPKGKRKQQPMIAKESSTTKKARTNEDDDNAASTKKKPTATAKTKQITYQKLQSLPRVSETTMTLAQLSAELLARQPAAKGLSNKTKDWFVEQLGEGSIWTTAPGIAIHLTPLPTVSDQMTLVQLKEELQARQPTVTGLSNKTKDWFVQRLGIGSICTTLLRDKKSSALSPIKKSEAPVAGQEKKKTSVTKKVPTPSSSAKVASSASKTKATVQKESPAAAKKSKLKPVATASLSTAKLLPPTAPKAVKVEKQKPDAAKPKVTKTTTSSSAAAAMLPVPVPSFPRLHVVDLVERVVPPKTAAIQNPRIKQESATKEAKPKNASEPERNMDGLPIVSSKMTMPQLKEELLTRDPGFKGYSKLKSADFLAQLGIGSVWESHPDSLQARACELKVRHCFSSRAHQHPMADSSLIRCSAIFGTQKTRSQTATCDRSSEPWCRRIPYRSCMACDYDLCLACYEIECMPEAGKRAELNRRYAQIAREEVEADRRYEEEERREMARQEASERRRKQEFEQRHAADLKRFRKIVRDPSAKHLNENNKLEFTIWTSYGHAHYDGPLAKEFNSSYATIKEANQRVEFVFLFNNPWERDLDEMSPEEDKIDARGFRRMEESLDGGTQWTVSAVPSQVFEYLD